MESTDRAALFQHFGRNAYRVLGLPANASQRTILERAAAMDRAARVGIKPQHSPWDLAWYGPLQQDRSAIAHALERLNNPRQRLTERLFWISQSERFVADLSPTTLNTAQILRSSQLPADKHDAEVLALVVCFLTDIDVQHDDRWVTTFNLWWVLLESEEFWDGFRDTEELSDFEPAASSEDLEQLRANSLQLVSETVAELARDAASRSEFDRCRRGLEIIRQTAFPAELVSDIEESVFGPYEDNLIRTSKEIKKRCWADIRQDRASAELNQQPCSVAVNRWNEELEPRYCDLIAMAGPDSATGLRVRQECGDFLVGLANSLTWADQWVEAERFLTEALSYLALDSPARERIEGSLRGVAREAAQARAKERERRHQADIEGFEHLCEEVCLDRWTRLASTTVPDPIGPCERAHQRYQDTVVPWLSILCAADSESSPSVFRAKVAAARCLFAIAKGFRYYGEYDRVWKRSIMFWSTRPRSSLSVAM